jgi:predicted nucleic acid-binding protein
MPVTFDTSIFIARRPEIPRAGFKLSTVVLQELVAGVGPRPWEAIYRRLDREGNLIVPEREDWWQAGKVLYSILRGLRPHPRGRTPHLTNAKKQSIIRDILIALSAKRARTLVVTENVSDFMLINDHCGGGLRFKSGADYFSRRTAGG